ncbi:DUF6616 family protein [Microbacterium sp. RD1]|uniref:DUF6616 family protein n=1 Tax=Microbacterium sp. RD1 TaxID=3457313 RepID=UPI003FA5B3F5
MYILIELWNGNDAWRALSEQERGDYMAVVPAGNAALLEKGIRLAHWGVNDSDVDRRADYQYFAIWECPNREAAREFENAVVGASWYDYFDQVNLGGESGDPIELSLLEAQRGD